MSLEIFSIRNVSLIFSVLGCLFLFAGWLYRRGVVKVYSYLTAKDSKVQQAAFCDYLHQSSIANELFAACRAT